jgi:hypothetical protein
VLLLLDEQLTPFGYATIEIEREKGRERERERERKRARVCAGDL